MPHIDLLIRFAVSLLYTPLCEINGRRQDKDGYTYSALRQIHWK